MLTQPEADLLHTVKNGFESGEVLLYAPDAAACRMGRARLEKEQITFKQTPYDLQVP